MSDFRLSVGERAPEIILRDIQGNEISLSKYWAGGPTLVSFLRHFG